MYGWYEDHMGGWAWAVMTLEVVLLVAPIVFAAYLGASLATRDRRRESR